MVRFVLALLLLSGCAHRRDLLVIAPHPDDEALLAAGAMAKARAEGRSVSVIIVTNGDFTCERDGYLREAESVRALAKLGVTDVHFLGYPDGALARLGKQPLDPLEHRDATGECVARTGTYADRAEGRLDEHTRRTGAPGDWTAEALTGDLTALLELLRPREVILPHAIDDHADHAATYIFFRRALEQLELGTPIPVRVLRGVVHAGRCWPSDCETNYTPKTPMPPLPKALAGYVAQEKLRINAEAKLSVITTYVSQSPADIEADWLASFARTDEVFWPERYERDDGHLVQSPDDGEATTLDVPAEWHGYSFTETGVTFEGRTLRTWLPTQQVYVRRERFGAYDEWSAWGDDGFIAGWVASSRSTSP